jgi:hypothetical protein
MGREGPAAVWSGSPPESPTEGTTWGLNRYAWLPFFFRKPFILLRRANEQTGSIAGSKADDDCAERHAAAVPPSLLRLLLLPAGLALIVNL